MSDAAGRRRTDQYAQRRPRRPGDHLNTRSASLLLSAFGLASVVGLTFSPPADAQLLHPESEFEAPIGPGYETPYDPSCAGAIGAMIDETLRYAYAYSATMVSLRPDSPAFGGQQASYGQGSVMDQSGEEIECQDKANCQVARTLTGGVLQTFSNRYSVINNRYWPFDPDQADRFRLELRDTGRVLLRSFDPASTPDFELVGLQCMGSFIQGFGPDGTLYTFTFSAGRIYG